MKEIFDEFEPELKELKPTVKEKALEIAGKLLTEKSMSRTEALKQGIKQAEEWFIDLEI
ncbi:hypothetical protein N9R54_00240 [Pelobium sp.]|nr:hypothetical protein [Pelobium sp.]MDA9554636.1 hypothetical protein [Pelobium sp.]